MQNFGTRWLGVLVVVSLLVPSATRADAPAAAAHDGAHDFDFLIGDWKAHLRKLLHPLTGSTTWIEYDGTSRTKKILGSNVNLEEFEVDSPAAKAHIKGQTLRLYNPDSHQWRIYLLNVDKGVLSLPPVVGQFSGGIGEFVDEEDFNCRPIVVRYQWSCPSPKAAHMEQAFSTDKGKTWEVNWICDLSR